MCLYTSRGVSAAGRSLVQRRRTDCGVCDLESKAVLAHLGLLRQRAVHCLWIGMLLPGSSLTELIVTTKQFFL